MKSVIQNSSVTGYSNKRRFVPNNGLGQEHSYFVGLGLSPSNGGPWVVMRTRPRAANGLGGQTCLTSPAAALLHSYRPDDDGPASIRP